MSKRYEAVAVREYEANGETKKAFTNIGVAFEMKDRDGYSLRLHCLPAPVNGEYSILLFPPKPREDQEREPRRQERRSPSYADRDDARTQRHSRPADDLDDDIPF